jgi:L-ascorbate metabolism protein UlaG (beta-lactamase superfamily)
MQRSPARSIPTALAWFVIGGLLTACQSGSGRTQGGAPQLSAADELTLPASQEPTDTATGSVTFIGNATVLIRYAGLTILTDPTFIHKHEQVSIGYGLHTTRLTDPAMDIRDLPPLDFILLSHFHGDHFDQVAERDLNKSLPIVTTPEAVIALHERGFKNASALKTWSTKTIKKGEARVRITSMPGRHGPPVVDSLLPDVMGSMLEFRSTPDSPPFRLYITGDTLVIDDLKEIPRRYPDIHLALLHLGGTRVLGVMVTMDAQQGVEVMQLVKPRMSIPSHYDDYDVFTSPLSDFQRAVKEERLEDRVHYLNHGETYTFRVAQNR